MVSIVIPTYNGEAYLRQTIDSCLNQSYKDIQIIIIDDCSTDASWQVTQHLAASDPRILVVYKSMNSGFCKTSNMGIKISNGAYLIVLGQDDILPQNHVEAMVQSFSDDIAMLYCNYAFIDENNKIIGRKKYENDEVIMQDLIKNCIGSCGVMIRKSALLKAGGYPENDEYPNYGEWDTWIRLLAYGRIKLCTETESFYRRHESNVTNTFAEYGTARKLNRYWNQCRVQAIQKSNISAVHRIVEYGRLFLKNIAFTVSNHLALRRQKK